MMRAGLIRLAVLSALAAAVAVQAAAATEVKCRMRDEIRRIKIVLDPDPNLICEVRYANSDMGGRGTVLWISKQDRTFCHDRADQLIARLARTGWVCDVMRKRNVAEGFNRDSGPAIAVPRPHR